MGKIPQDHRPKPATNAAMIQTLMRNIQQIYSVFGDFDRRLTALSRAKMDPKTLAKFILDGDENSKFIKNLNDEIDVELKKQELEQQKKLMDSITPSTENQKTPE